MINANKNARVCIRGRAYPKVKVLIDDVGWELTNLTRFVTFLKDHETGEMRLTPYH